MAAEVSFNALDMDRLDTAGKSRIKLTCITVAAWGCASSDRCEGLDCFDCVLDPALRHGAPITLTIDGHISVVAAATLCTTYQHTSITSSSSPSSTQWLLRDPKKKLTGKALA